MGFDPQQCEFCERHASIRLARGAYVRYACAEHEARVQRLVYLDLGNDAANLVRVEMP